ncbi:ornithine carbamoyltransferase [Enterococcus plantarum]|uniref:Ornithine carbamoyltransferase n=1 Tax=Enterococcus plantarum TaxID=1077675 RepID=A0A2W3Z4Z0_9ENTE|nr:ornithine carbamoyltransferase [Enterococcus plantarum]MBO0421390.1 ornithine carbamoyltransferase [Enterococcus plantarum]OEG14726.1 ornithine carbamoyltransferase [Enterococcus plantarum]PZL75198.1 ornithine carbamoyltransferase [Enterococcus plantarum]
MNTMYGKSILNLTELTKEEFLSTIELAVAIKANPESYRGILAGKIIAMIFEKNSTRTRVSFEAGIIQLGGQAIVLDSKSTQMGRGEPVKDTANVLSSYVDAIMIRTYSDKMVAELAAEASIPVINGLTDDHHPCQILADFQTIYEQKGKLEGIRLTYIGDGNNMAHSFLIGGSLVGMDVTIATPKGYGPKAEFVEVAKKNAEISGSKIHITHDPEQAAKNADVLITDVWASMGDESEQKEREEIFKTFQVNNRLAVQAKKDYLFLHCLPAHRGEEVSADIIDGIHSAIYQEAENRLHAQKALMVKLMANL